MNRNTAAVKERQRRYNSPEHRAARKAFGLLVAAGTAHCWRCGRHIPPGSQWHVGHDDSGQRIMGPEHARSCNLKAAAKKGARTTNRQRLGLPAPRVARKAPRDFT